MAAPRSSAARRAAIIATVTALVVLSILALFSPTPVRGAVFKGHHEVLDIRVTGGRVTAVVTSHGEIPADLVLCCAGIWGPKITKMVGMRLPLLGFGLAKATHAPDAVGLFENDFAILGHPTEVPCGRRSC